MSQRSRDWVIAGIAIRMHAGSLIVLLLLTWTAAIYFRDHGPDLSQPGYWMWAASAVVAFLTSMVCHELGHVLAARLTGIRVSGITLFGFGAVVEFEQPPASPAVEALIAAAGPLASGAIAATAWLVGGLPAVYGSPDLAILLKLIAWGNTCLLVFNLLPALPLDGGCIVHAICWHLAGDPQRATRWTTRCDGIVAASLLAIGAACISMGQVLLGSGLCLGGLWLGPGEMILKSSAEEAYEDAPAHQIVPTK